MLICINASAQELRGVVRDSITHKPLDYASVVVYGEQHHPITFQHTHQDGTFSITLPEGKKATSISFSILGYAKKSYPLAHYKNGQNVYLHEAATSIKEVTVKAKRLKLLGDTLAYSVAGFRHKQDRTIADVIAKMPGLNVKENGTITYQGKAINKFYIEGMDLMGSRYATASENIDASKVKTVEVLQRHQPIKALRGKSFTDQASLNLVLTDDAKGVWTGNVEIGGGTKMQEGEGPNWLRNGKLAAMMFSRKLQSITMYKTNNTGKDISHEINSLSSDNSLDEDEASWVSNISASSTTELAQGRTNFNNTHLVATNWLRRIGKDTDLRLQASYLYDHSTAKKYDKTLYTNILGRPAIEEETEANSYRNEARLEMQYKLNSSQNYLNNTFRSSFNWNHSAAETRLSGNAVRQAVRPHKTYIGDELRMMHNISQHSSYNLQVSGSYTYLPSLLQLLDNQTQHLDVTISKLNASTTFRHKLWGMKISYDAQLNYKREEGKLNFTTSEMNETNKTSKINGMSKEKETDKEIEKEAEKQYMQKLEALLTPSIGYSNNSGLSLSASASMKFSRYDLSHDGATKFHISPSLSAQYQLNATSDIQAGYRLSYSVLPFLSITSLPYYANYSTQVNGNGKWNDLATHMGWATFKYGDPGIGLFFNINANYSKTLHQMLYDSWLTGDVYHAQQSDMESSQTTKTLNGNISKAFGMGKMSIDIGGDAMWVDYDILLQKEKMPYQNRFYTGYFKLAVMPSTLFSIEEKSTFRYSKQVNKRDEQLNGESLRTDQHDLRLLLMPGCWEIEWTNSLYHSTDRNVDNAYFSDASITYSKRRYEISLRVSNLFGTKKYEYHQLSDSFMHGSVNYLRPREIFVNVAFSL